MQGLAVEKYKGNIVISARWLIDNAVMTKDMYDWENKQRHVNVVRRGCKGTPALVDWRTLPVKYQAKVIELIGDPIKVVNDNVMLREAVKLREARVKDLEAWDYFGKLTDANGRILKEDKVKALTNSAKILNAITDCLDEIKSASIMRKQSFSVKREFKEFAYQVENNLSDYEHDLPTSPDRLYKIWLDYSRNGYEALVHGSLGKQTNNKNKRSAEIEAVISELLSKGNKLSDVMVAKLMETMGVEIAPRRIQEIRKKNELINKPERDGVRKFNNEALMQVDRSRPSQPMLMWVSDGWDAELYYQDERSRYNRLTIVMVIDAFNDYIMGYAIGDHENTDLIIEAYRDAINHAELLLGVPVMPQQIQSDNYGYKVLPPYYATICKEYTPAALGNAKSKVIEQYFRTVQSKLQLLPNYSGHNITAKKQTNDEWISANSKYFPTRDECIRQLQALVEIERSERRQALLQAWMNRDEAKVLMLDRCSYLAKFGERSRGNMLTPNGIKLIRDGVEYKYECADIKMREMRGERWTICYNRTNMNVAVAESEDGRMRFELHAKVKVPMAIADCTEEDFKVLQGYRDFNKQLKTYVGERRAANQALAIGYVEKKQLAGTFAGRLLTENGQHKDLKAKERKRLAAMKKEAEDVEVIKEEKKEREIVSIYSKM